jgi:hypothetical protein
MRLSLVLPWLQFMHVNIVVIAVAGVPWLLLFCCSVDNVRRFNGDWDC